MDPADPVEMADPVGCPGALEAHPSVHPSAEHRPVPAETAKEAWGRPCFLPDLFGGSFPRLGLSDPHLSWAAALDKCGAPGWERRELFLKHP